MEIQQKILIKNSLNNIVCSTSESLQERNRSPNADVICPSIARISYGLISDMIDFQKPVSSIHTLGIKAILSIGSVFLFGSIMGKKWKPCAGNLAVELVIGSLFHLNTRLNKQENVNYNKFFLYSLLINIIGNTSRMAFQKHRNPSLVLKSYIIHNICLQLINSSFVFLISKNKSIKDDDTKRIFIHITSLCNKNLLLIFIQKIMGDNSIKINWKIQVLTQSICFLNDFLCLSKRSPISI